MDSRYTYVWEFRVAADLAAEFERHYGPAGTWAQLFGHSPDYIETLLLKDAATPGRYLTVDRWRSAEGFRSFRSRFAAQYEQLDATCETLTLDERSLGAFSESPPGL